MDLLNVMLFSVLVIPHLAVIIAWATWLLPQQRLPKIIGRVTANDASANSDSHLLTVEPSGRAVILFLALLACSINILVFWGGVRNQDFQNQSELFRVFLLFFAVFAGCIGKGQSRVPVAIAALVEFPMLIFGHIGIL